MLSKCYYDLDEKITLPTYNLTILRKQSSQNSNRLLMELH